MLWRQGNLHEGLLELQDELRKKPTIDLKLPENSSNGGIGMSEDQLSDAAAASLMGGANNSNNNNNSNSINNGSNGDLLIAKTMLLVGRWLQQTGQAHHESIIATYKQIIHIQPR